MCAHNLTNTHTHRLHPTPPLHHRSCPVLTEAHLPQPEAINAAAAATNPPTHSTPYQLSLHTSAPLSPSLSLFTSLCLSFRLFLTPPPPSRKHIFSVLYKRNLAVLFSGNEMHFPSFNSITECCVPKWFMNTLLYCQGRMKEEVDSYDSL